MIKILIVTTVKVGYDGLTSHIFSYIKNMDKNGMQIDLVSARGIDEKIMPQLKAVGFHEIYRLESRDADQLKYFVQLTKLIRRNKYHIMHVHGNSSTLAVDLFAGVMGGCRVRIAHSHNTSCQHMFLNRILKPFFLACCTNRFACSEAAGKWLFGQGPFVVIPNGKEIEKYLFNPDKRKKMRDSLGLADGVIAICHVAAFVPTKNHTFVIDMFDQLVKEENGFELYLFGIDGVTLESVKQQISRSAYINKIHLMGTRDDIQDYLQAMDIMILPSRYEGFPLSMMEGQISGLICMASTNVSNTVNITGKIEFLPINNGVSPWIDAIKKHKEQGIARYTKGICETFTQAGFNIRQNAKGLRNRYLELAGMYGQVPDEEKGV